MLFNCIHCCKVISTNFEKCPYCQSSIVEVSHQITGIVLKEKKPLSEEKTFKGTVVSLLSRPRPAK